jgi:hypothetical protein
VVLTVVLWVFRHAFLAPLILKGASSVLSRQGILLTVEDLRGSWISDVELTGVHLRGADGSGFPLRVDADTIQASYSLGSLLSGTDDFLASLRVAVRSAEVEVDLRTVAASDDGEIADPTAGAGRAIPTIPDVTISDTRVRLLAPDLDLEIENLAVTVARQPDGRQEVMVSCPRVTADAILSRGPVSIELAALLEGNRATIERLLLDEAPLLEDLAVTFLEDGSLEGEGRVLLPGSRLDLSASLDGETLTGRATFNALQIDRLQELPLRVLAPGLPLAGRIEGTVEGEVSLPFWVQARGEVDLTIVSGSVAGTPLDEATIKARASAEEIEVQRLVVHQGGNRVDVEDLRVPRTILTGGGDVGAELTRAASGRFSLDVPVVEELLALLGVDTAELPLPEGLAVSARGAVRETRVDVDEARVRGQGLDIVVTGLRSELPLDRPLEEVAIQGDVSIESCELSGLNRLLGDIALSGSLTGTAKVTGRAGSPRGEASLFARDIEMDGTRLGNLTIEAEGGLDGIEVRQLLVENGEDRIVSRATVWPLERRLVATVSVLRLEDASVYSMGALKEALRIEGRIEEAEVALPDGGEMSLRVRGDFTTVIFGDRPPGAVVFAASLASGRIRLEQVEATAGGSVRASLQGSLPFPSAATAPGDLPLDLSLRLSCGSLLEVREWFALESTSLPDGNATVNIALEGSLGHPRGRVSLEAAGTLPALPSASVAGGMGSIEGSGALVLDGNRISIEDLVWKSPSLGTVRIAGSVTGLPLPSDLLGPGSSGDGPAWAPSAWTAELDALIDVPDLKVLETVVGLRRLEGATSVDVRVSGSLLDPALEGVIQFQDMSIRMAPELPAVESLTGKARFVDRRVVLEDITGEYGAAPFTVAGTVDFTHLEDPALKVTLRGTDLLLFRAHGIKLRADADLSLSGPVSRLHLAGTVDVSDGRLARNIPYLDLLQEQAAGVVRQRTRQLKDTPDLVLFRDPPLSEMTFDLRIGAKNAFQVNNNLARGGLRPDVRVGGTGRAPRLLGKVYLDPTMIFLPSVTLLVTGGVAEFGAAGPFAPRVDMTAEARIQGYDVTVVVQGVPSELEVQLSSVPPLPDEDLLLLVLTGRAPRDAGLYRTSQDTLLEVASFLGRDFLVRVLDDESVEAGESFLQRFEVVTGRDVTDSGEETIEATFLLRKDLLRPDASLYLAGERDRYDDFNLGLKMVFRFR